jgi:hypothetical protein
LSIRLIKSAIPSWFTATEESEQEIVGTAIIEIPGASKDYVIDIKISCSAKTVFAYEAVIGTILPAACPERHINGDGSFCLGFDAQTYATDRDRAEVWWNLLRNFLKLQHTASRSRSWPQRQALSHGDAGEHHLKALEAASKLGIEEDYYRMLEGEPAWFSNPLLRVQKSAGRLCNGRRPCPKGCKKKNGNPVSRRDCDRKELIVALIFHEIRRRKAEKEFWKVWVDAGRQCCGSMNHCPLRDATARTQMSKPKERARP